jgi:RNA-directed DNA polymerase
MGGTLSHARPVQSELGAAIITTVYDHLTRRLLAHKLAEAFLGGRWRARDLAQRGAGVLDRRPEWINALASSVAPLGRPLRDSGAHQNLVAHIEAFLADPPDSPSQDGESTIVIRPRPGQQPPRLRRELEHTWPIAAIDSQGELAERLELDTGQLAWLADVRGLERLVASERLRNYRYRWLPRRSGLPRLIEAPKLRLKEIQRWVLHEILDHVPPHEAAHGFTRGRSVLTHAALHTGQPGVLRLDLRDFFATIAAGRVYGIFRTVGYSGPVAHALTGLCTNVTARMVWAALPAELDPDLVWRRSWLRRRLATPHLPQGAPTSPALANLVAFGLDRRLAGLAAAFGLTYSRYADDLTLSGPGLTGARSRAIAGLAAEIARDEGFSVNPAKSNLRTAARRQTVTGVVVNAHPNVARNEYDRLRATLHRAALHGPGAVRLRDVGVDGDVDVQAHLRGRVAWVTSLNPPRGEKLQRMFDAVDWSA